MKKKAFSVPVSRVNPVCIHCHAPTAGHFLYCPAHLDPAARPARSVAPSGPVPVGESRHAPVPGFWSGIRTVLRRG